MFGSPPNFPFFDAEIFELDEPVFSFSFDLTTEDILADFG